MGGHEESYCVEKNQETSQQEIICINLTYFIMKEMKISNIIKGVIAVMLLLCLITLPYGMYTLIRFCAAAAFIYFAIDYISHDKKGLGYTFIALAALFQPFLKVHLGRVIWNCVDVAVALLLIVLLVKSLSDKR